MRVGKRPVLYWSPKAPNVWQTCYQRMAQRAAAAGDTAHFILSILSGPSGSLWDFGERRSRLRSRWPRCPSPSRRPPRSHMPMVVRTEKPKKRRKHSPFIFSLITENKYSAASRRGVAKPPPRQRKPQIFRPPLRGGRFYFFFPQKRGKKNSIPAKWPNQKTSERGKNIPNNIFSSKLRKKILKTK